MPDQRKHRGPHPEDHRLFGIEELPNLSAATSDLNWLLTRGYANTSAIKLVGDRYSLDARQRVAVVRCACGVEAFNRRLEHEVGLEDLAGQDLWLDGYNVLTTLEAALSGGVILQASDGCYRDMASMHGSYRKVEETVPALTMLGEFLAETSVAHCRWLLDKPVSNSGRLKTMIQELSSENGWDWNVELVPDPDPLLIRADGIVASADSWIIDRAERWLNLAKLVTESYIPDAWFVNLKQSHGTIASVRNFRGRY